MECYVKIDRTYDSLTPFHGYWGIYKNVRTGQKVSVEEGEQEDLFIGNNLIITWEEYQRRMEYEKYGIHTDQVEKYGLIGRNYDKILKSYGRRLEDVLPKTELLYEKDKGYFDIHFLEILMLICQHRQIPIFHTYENEGYQYKRSTSYDVIDELYKFYTEVSHRLLLARHYKNNGIQSEITRKKVEELIYHLLANHTDTASTCNNLLDIDEFRALLEDEEIGALINKVVIPWTIRIPSPWDRESLVNGLVKLSYKGISPTECAIINYGELNSYLRQNSGIILPALYSTTIMNISRDFPVLLPFISQQEGKDSTITFESKNKVYSIGGKIF